MKGNHRLFYAAVFIAASLNASCYAPDYTRVVYRCDRGKCPEDFYCVSDNYCTQKVEICAIGGVQIGDTAAVCIGRANSMDPMSAICAMGAASSKCDMQTLSGDLCKNVSNCSYCCR